MERWEQRFRSNFTAQVGIVRNGGQVEDNKTIDEFLKSFLGRFFDPALDGEKIEMIVENLADHLPETLGKSSSVLLCALKERAPSMLSARREDLAGFRDRLRQVWGKALDLLEMCIAIATEAGAEFAKEYCRLEEERPNYRFEALVRLHARGCQVASEVLELLASGFADGADARWRTAHELAVIAFFISERSDEVSERYLMYRAIESYKDALKYQKHAKQLGYAPFTDEEFQSIRANRDDMCKRFGPDFAHRYGWASKELDNPKPTFADIESSVKMEHYRPHFKMATQNVHAGPGSLFFRLGDPRERHTLLAGASNAGLADPGQSTAISLYQHTTTLLYSAPTFERLVVLKAFEQLLDETKKAFIDAHVSLEEAA